MCKSKRCGGAAAGSDELQTRAMASSIHRNNKRVRNAGHVEVNVQDILRFSPLSYFLLPNPSSTSNL